jgi:streptogramin lyase
MQGFKVLLASLVLLVACGAGAAFAGQGGSGSDPGLPTAEDFVSAFEEGNPESTPDETNPQAAEGVALNDIDRTEAVDLLQGVFEPVLKNAAGIFDELEVERFLSPTVAVVQSEVGASPPAETSESVEGENEKPEPPEAAVEEGPAAPEGSGRGQISHATLLDSTIPLKTEGPSGGSEAVDLSLEHVEGELQSSNPLVEVGVPQELGEGIDLPEVGVHVSVADMAQDRTPSTIDNSIAAYPNVAADTDLAVAPTPTGFETLTQLRSDEAPHSQTFNLSMPEGAQLIASENGGAEVKRGGETLVGIDPPTAIDATGAEVPVSLEVSGNSLTLHVELDETENLPVLVDPLFQTYAWEGSDVYKNGLCNSSFEYVSGGGGISPCGPGEEWRFAAVHNPSSNGRVGRNNTYYAGAPPYVPAGANGLIIEATDAVTNGDYGTWSYAVPRYYTDPEKFKDPQGKPEEPTSYVSHMTLWDLLWKSSSGNTTSPWLHVGLWDAGKNAFVSEYSHQGGTEHGVTDVAHHYEFSYLSDKGVKSGTVTVTATENQAHADSLVFVGDAAMELGDVDTPNVTAGVPSQWVNQTPGTVPMTAKDTGLGVSSITLKERRSGGLSWKTSYGCLGVGDSACPRVWTTESGSQPLLKYEPAVLPQGIAELEEYAEDPVGNKSATFTQQVKVDHTPPKVATSGTITEQATLGTSLPTYTLNYTATDGESESAAALSPFGSLEAGNLQMKRPEDIAVDGSGHIWMVDREANCVKEFDEEGHYITQFGSTGSGNGQLQGPSDIVRTAAGNFWVTDTGNHRVEEFNASGAYVQQFGSLGNGNNQFSSPFGIASNSEGALWVSDSATGRVAEFRENVSQESERFLRNASAPNPGVSPAGVAVDSHNNVWVADNGHHRLVEFSPSGTFVMSVGSEGAGSGQLKSPYNIAIAPSGNLLVTDAGNNRIEEFQPEGNYLRQFGSSGAGSGQFSEPRGLAFAAKNTAFIADAGNHRVTRWSHADYDPQSGAASVEVKVDGSKVIQKYTPGCATKNCVINKEVVLNSSEYSAGEHTVEVTATDGVGLPTTKKLPIKLSPSPPSLSLSGSITEQATLGITRPRYTLNAEAAPNGKVAESSGLPTFISAFGSAGSGTGQLSGPRGITADGKGHVWVIDAANNRVEEFSEAGAYIGQFGSAGTGNGQFSEPWGIAVTPAGNLWVIDTGNKRVEEFNSKGEFMQKFGTKASGSSKGTEFVTPEGIAIAPGGMIWVSDTGGARIGEFRESVSSESERFVRNVATTGTGNPGLSAPMGLAVDSSGNLWATDQTPKRILEYSPEGAFLKSFGKAGSGEGQLETPKGLAIGPEGDLYVVDRGNNRVEVFSPQGEFIDQFGTSGTGNGQFSEPRAIAIGAEGAIFVSDKGNNRVHRWTSGGGALETTGVPDPSTIATNPAGGFTIQTPGTTISAAPTDVLSEATPLVNAEEAAAVGGNIKHEVDTVVRPIYDGILAFGAIRSNEAPETLTWEVHLGEGQTLKAIDSQHAGIYYENGAEAGLISAEPAHDAVGATVPTHISVSAGNVVTLTVEHRESSYVYPVVAGTGWEGGFRTETVLGPMDEQELHEQREREERERREALEHEGGGASNGPLLLNSFGEVGPPEPDPEPAEGETATASSTSSRVRVPFSVGVCTWWESEQICSEQNAIHDAHDKPPYERKLMWRGETRGAYHIIKNHKAWYSGNQYAHVNCGWILNNGAWEAISWGCAFNGAKVSTGGTDAHIVDRSTWDAPNPVLGFHECVDFYVKLYSTGFYTAGAHPTWIGLDDNCSWSAWDFP